MGVVTELLRFPASDAFVKDRLVFKSALDILVKAEGLVSIYHGLQTEDGRTGYLIVVWNTYEHHKQLMEQANYPELLEALKPAVAGKLDLQHVEFDKDPAAALGSPATEVIILKPKSDESKDLFLSKFQTLREELNKSDSCISSVWGESRENNGSYVAVVGWKSLQAHVDTVKQGVLPEIIASLYTLSDIDLKHTSLVKYSD